MNWVFFAILSAVFAALVNIFGKIGVKGIDSNLAVAIRTVIIVFFAWGIVAIARTSNQLAGISKHTLAFLVLSAIATGASWLFYYHALQLGEASKVVSIDKLSVPLTVLLAVLFLGEAPTIGNILGGSIVTIGVLVTIFIK